jgi:hypothetical protein
MIGLIALIVVLGGALLIVTSYMEWTGLKSVITPRRSPRYTVCGHLRMTPDDPHDRCWKCRHPGVDHAIHGLRH